MNNCFTGYIQKTSKGLCVQSRRSFILGNGCKFLTPENPHGYCIFRHSGKFKRPFGTKIY